LRSVLRRLLEIADGAARRWYCYRLRVEGVQLGAGAFIRGRVQTGDPRRLRCGVDMRVGSGVILSASTNGRITIGDHVLINDYVVISSGLEITIEDWVTIAPHCQIVDGDHGTTDPDRPIRQQDENYVQAPVRIGRDAWLGCHVVVLKGVTIGAGAIVGAGSVVTRDVPERANAVGVPARVVGWRGEPPASVAE
jgi:acetyltransferase-like isoleucine patch superfamily enzyme